VDPISPHPKKLKKKEVHSREHKNWNETEKYERVIVEE
jgi:hypothetical protein